jgi:hypothetical protein
VGGIHGVPLKIAQSGIQGNSKSAGPEKQDQTQQGTNGKLGLSGRFLVPKSIGSIVFPHALPFCAGWRHGEYFLKITASP